MRRPTGRAVGALVAGVLAAVALAVVLTSGGLVGSGPPETQPAPPPDTTTAAPAPASPTPADDVPTVVPVGDDAAEPVSLEIAAVGISSTLDPLDLLANGEVEAPPRWQVAGWYAGGSRPGETGPAVIAGHVDSPDGPAVFTSLTEVRAGDVVDVTDAEGTVHRFRVDRTQVAPRDRFPTRAVYGPTPDAQLRLITCDGPYVAAAGGYQDNFIVYATEASP